MRHRRRSSGFFRTFENYRHYGKAGNYLYVIAGNVCKDYLRKKREIVMADLPEIEEKVWKGWRRS